MKSNIRNAPELEWLKADLVNGTPEGSDTVNKEYKRTLCSIELLNFVLEENYVAFSNCQPETTRISKEVFFEICEYVKSVLKTGEDEEAMRVFLVINELGKVKDYVKKVAESMNIKSVDHDLILYEGLKEHPEFSPSFFSLSSRHRKLILTGLKTGFNIGQFVQCECLPANLETLEGIDLESFNFYMIHSLFAIAGAAGHLNQNGSLVCNELYWKKFSWALDAVTDFIMGKYGAKEAYKNYLTKTMEYYKVYDIAVGKLCNIMRLSTPGEANNAELAFNNLSPEYKRILKKELMATGIGKDTAILIYYAPAMFQNALSYYKNFKPNIAISKTINKIAPIISRIYRNIRLINEIKDGYIVAFISELAKAAMEPDNITNILFIYQVGDDFIVKCE